MTSSDGVDFAFAIRLDTAGIRRLYPKIRKALLDVGYQLTDTVDVMRVLERLIATSIDRDAKRLDVRVHTLGNGTHLEVIDRRRFNPRASLPSEIVSPEIARASGADILNTTSGVVLWALVDRRPRPGGPSAV